jgi:hypothetical protein
MFTGPNIVTNGLVLHLDAANTKSYPGSGTTWFDKSGNNKNGTLINGPTLSTGSILFDGTNDGVTLGPGTNFPYPYHTYEMWVKTPGLGAGMTIAGLFGMDYGRVIYLSPPSTVRYEMYSGSSAIISTGIQVPNTNLFDDKYHQVVCLRNTTVFEIYVDGILRQTGGNGGVPTWDGLNVWSTMGAQLANNPNDAYFKLLGSIAIAKIYNRGLSQAEILQNYNATKTRFGL